MVSRVTLLLLTGIFNLAYAGSKLKAKVHASYCMSYEECLDDYKNRILPTKFHEQSLYIIEQLITKEFRLLELPNVLVHRSHAYVKNITFKENDRREVKTELVPGGLITTNMFRSYSGNFNPKTFFREDMNDFNLCKSSRRFSCSYTSDQNDWTHFKSILDTSAFERYFDTVVLTFHDFKNAEYHMDLDKRMPVNDKFKIKKTFPWRLNTNSRNQLYLHANEAFRRVLFIKIKDSYGTCTKDQMIANVVLKASDDDCMYERLLYSHNINKKYPQVYIYYNSQTKLGSNVPADLHYHKPIHHVSVSFRLSDLYGMSPHIEVKNAYILYPSDQLSTTTTTTTPTTTTPTTTTPTTTTPTTTIPITASSATTASTLITNNKSNNNSHLILNIHL